MRRRCAEVIRSRTRRQSVTLIEGSVATTFLPFHLAPSGKIFDVTDRYIKIVGRGYVCMWVAGGRPPRGGGMYVCWWLGKSYPRTYDTYVEKKPNPGPRET